MLGTAHSSIAISTCREIVRQPAFAVVTILGLLSLSLAPALSGFSLRHGAGIVKEVGASTYLLAGVVAAVLGAASAVRREIELGATLLVLSKPVSRTGFIVAKFLGVAAALGLVGFVFAAALLLVTRQGSGDAVAGHQHGIALDGPALVVGGGGCLLAVVIAGFASWRRGASFPASTLVLAGVALSAALATGTFLDAEWRPHDAGGGYDAAVASAAVLAYLALLVLASVAIAVSVWCRAGGTLLVTLAFFFTGLARGSLARELGGGWALLLELVPNIELFWLGDVFHAADAAPSPGYIAGVALYALLYVAAYLAIASWGLRRGAT